MELQAGVEQRARIYLYIVMITSNAMIAKQMLVSMQPKPASVNPSRDARCIGKK